MEQETGNKSSTSGQPEQISTPQARPGWFILPSEELPQPTYWPAAMALGIVFVLAGIVLTYWISGVGAVLFGMALAGWIRELRHE
jgi:hypothetical protein